MDISWASVSWYPFAIQLSSANSGCLATKSVCAPYMLRRFQGENKTENNMHGSELSKGSFPLHPTCFFKDTSMCLPCTQCSFVLLQPCLFNRLVYGSVASCALKCWCLKWGLKWDRFLQKQKIGSRSGICNRETRKDSICGTNVQSFFMHMSQKPPSQPSANDLPFPQRGHLLERVMERWPFFSLATRNDPSATEWNDPERERAAELVLCLFKA